MLYAFVSPVAALALGRIAFGEPLDATGLAGSALVPAGAWLALRSPETEQHP
jgi:drug/metabolite transporter (DMT)-like permease